MLFQAQKCHLLLYLFTAYFCVQGEEHLTASTSGVFSIKYPRVRQRAINCLMNIHTQQKAHHGNHNS
jgi:hypothetical protein